MTITEPSRVLPLEGHHTLRAPSPPSAPAPADTAVERTPEPFDVARWAPRGFYVRVGRPLLQGAVLAVTLPLSLPLLLGVGMINLALFRDPRRVLFTQPRVGLYGRVFRIYKFRTMREARDGAYDSWSSGGDGLRVTRFGRLLRNTHLDELPQLINVLCGDMALIGPRPEMVEVEEWARSEVPGFELRLVIRPGLTGLAQITQGYTGRDVRAYARKLALNAVYLRRMSLVTDLRIMCGTALWMLRGRGWWRKR